MMIFYNCVDNNLEEKLWKVNDQMLEINKPIHIKKIILSVDNMKKLIEQIYSVNFFMQYLKIVDDFINNVIITENYTNISDINLKINYEEKTMPLMVAIMQLKYNFNKLEIEEQKEIHDSFLENEKIEDYKEEEFKKEEMNQKS